MQSIVIASQTEEESTLLKKKFEPLGQVFEGLTYKLTTPQRLIYEVDHSVSLVVLNLQHFRPEQKSILQSMRQSGYDGPIMIVARPHSPEFLKECVRLENVFFLEKPFETRDLIGIAHKYLRTRQVNQRIFRRYRTHQTAKVHLYTSEDCNVSVNVHNLSKGGAYLEGNFETVFKVGEVLRLHFHLNELDRKYSVPARIVWKRTAAGGPGIGVEFLKSEEVYKYLIAAF